MIRSIAEHVTHPLQLPPCATPAAGGSHDDDSYLPQQPTTTLSISQVCSSFQERGYVVLHGFLDLSHAERIVQDLDGLPLVKEGSTARQSGTMGVVRCSTKSLGGLTTFPPTMRLLQALMPAGFALRHMNASVLTAGSAQNTWHHDYVRERFCLWRLLLTADACTSLKTVRAFGCTRSRSACPATHIPRTTASSTGTS